MLLNEYHFSERVPKQTTIPSIRNTLYIKVNLGESAHIKKITIKNLNEKLLIFC